MQCTTRLQHTVRHVRQRPQCAAAGGVFSRMSLLFCGRVVLQSVVDDMVFSKSEFLNGRKKKKKKKKSLTDMLRYTNTFHLPSMRFINVCVVWAKRRSQWVFSKATFSLFFLSDVFYLPPACLFFVLFCFVNLKENWMLVFVVFFLHVEWPQRLGLLYEFVCVGACTGKLSFCSRKCKPRVFVSYRV